MKTKILRADSKLRFHFFGYRRMILNGCHIKLKVPLHEKPKYQKRKGEIATNVLAACTKDMQFTCVLPGWEGSAANSRVLQDALRRRHAFEVPCGGKFFFV